VKRVGKKAIFVVVLIFCFIALGQSGAKGAGFPSCHETEVVSMLLDEGWNLISLPLSPVDPDASAIFAGIPVAGNLYRFTAGVGYEIYPLDFQEMAPGRGYWLRLDEASVVQYEGFASLPSPEAMMEIGGWHLVGPPENKDLLYDQLLAGNIATREVAYLPDAAARGWIMSALYYYDAGYKMVPMDDPFLRPWRGYWAQALASDLVLSPAFIASPGQSNGEKTAAVSPLVNGVYAHSGEFTYSKTVLEVPGRGFDYELTIYYRSGIIYNGVLGKGWDFNHNMRLRELPYSGDVLLYDGTGREDRYAFVGGGLPYESPPGSYNILEKDVSGGFTLRGRYGGVCAFDKKGNLISITDRNGNTMTFSHCPICGKLIEATDTLGRTYTYDYDPTTGRLISVTDFSGRTVTFSYNSEGQLIMVTLPATSAFPSGIATSFTYSSGFADPRLNDNLLTITDGKGQTYLTNTYDAEDRIQTQDWGVPGSITTFEYLPGMTRTTDHNGYVNEYEYSPEGLPTRWIQYTHGIRLGAPPSYVQEYSHNANAELTQITLGRGNSIVYVFDETNPDPLQRGNLLEVRTISHIPGENPLTVHFTYEPVFNDVKTVTDSRSYVTTYYYDYEEATLGDLNGDGRTDQANGNLVKIEFPLVTLGQPAPQVVEEKFWYNDYGQVIRQINPDGQVVVYEYWDSGPGLGQLRYMIEDFGGLNLTTETGYDEIGHLIWETDPNGNTTYYEVDALGWVSKKTAPAPFNYETHYTYDANGNCLMVQVQNLDENMVPDPDLPWITTTYDYDILNHMVSKTEDVTSTHQATTLYEYDHYGNLISLTHPEGNQERWVYDERNLIYQHTRGVATPEESTETFTFDENRNLVEYQSGEGYITSYQYDGYDREVLKTDPMGNTTETTYEGLHLVSAITQRNAAAQILGQALYSYDELGRLYKLDRLHNDSAGNPVGDGWSTMQYIRDPAGRILKTIDDNGGELHNSYDGAGRLIRKSTPLPGGHENAVEYELDAWGNVLSETHLLYNERTGIVDVFVKTTAYDQLTRPIREAWGLPEVEWKEYEYNSRSLEVVERDGLGNVTSTEYDGLGREIMTTYDAGGVNATHQKIWDDNSRLVQQIDANGNVTTYEYDSLNRLVRVIYADSSERLMTYNRDDRLISRTNPNGTVETITCNAAGYPIQIDFLRGPGVIGPTRISYAYDGLNRIIYGQTEENGTILTTTTWAYDTLSNLDKETQKILSAPVHQISSSYDGVGNRTHLIYPDVSFWLTFTMDQANRTREIISPLGSLATFQYVGRRLASRQYLNGVVLDVSYNPAMRVATLSHNDALSRLIAGFEYAYDAAGRKKFENRLHDGVGDAYKYRGTGEMVGVKYGVNGLAPALEYDDYLLFDRRVEFTLDPEGNRMIVDEDGLQEFYNYSGGVYTPDPRNRYYLVDSTSRSHDANGNLTNDGTLIFAYDARNRVYEVHRVGEPLPIAEYLHDAIGRRVWCRAEDGTQTFYYYDREHCIEERDEMDNLTARYVWDPERGSVLTAERGGVLYFCHENALESVSVLTDITGTRVEKIDYEVYGKPSFYTWEPVGEVWLPSSASPTGNPYLFTSQCYDSPLGLYYCRNRYLDPTTGRYTCPDPEAGEREQSLNLYSYLDNDPTNRFSTYGTGDWVVTGSLQSITTSASEPFYEHIPLCYLDSYSQENRFSLYKKKHVKVKQLKAGTKRCRYGQAGLSGNNCNNTSGIFIQRFQQGNSVEIVVHFYFTVYINTSKVCKDYTERDPEIKKKRNGKPMTVHVTKGLIKAHEMTHVDQMMKEFQKTIQAALKRYNPKSKKSFPKQLKKRLKEAYQNFKKEAARNYPNNPIEREARQKALEWWDKNRNKQKKG